MKIYHVADQTVKLCVDSQHLMKFTMTKSNCHRNWASLQIFMMMILSEDKLVEIQIYAVYDIQ